MLGARQRFIPFSCVFYHVTKYNDDETMKSIWHFIKNEHPLLNLPPLHIQIKQCIYIELFHIVVKCSSNAYTNTKHANCVSNPNQFLFEEALLNANYVNTSPAKKNEKKKWRKRFFDHQVWTVYGVILFPSHFTPIIQTLYFLASSENTRSYRSNMMCVFELPRCKQSPNFDGTLFLFFFLRGLNTS